MECPTCSGQIDPTLCNVELDAEEEGVEVNFVCPYCREEHFAVLTTNDFAPVC